MELLTTKQEVSEYFNISIGRSEKEFNAFIYEAQEFYLKPLLSEHLYNELIQIPNKYDFILNKHLYWLNNSTGLSHEGLKSVLAQFTYAIYILKGNITDSSFGIQQKTNPNSEPISYQERKDWYYRHIQQANALFKDVEKYIYYRYKSNPKYLKTKKTNFKISVIK